ncbi:hypothetical protein OG21DRAFT_1527385 [Imleria badia]|nr:hypothetical protein OG21DRAFT_1527385 [Imleria badia]
MGSSHTKIAVINKAQRKECHKEKKQLQAARAATSDAPPGPSYLPEDVPQALSTDAGVNEAVFNSDFEDYDSMSLGEGSQRLSRGSDASMASIPRPPANKPEVPSETNFEFAELAHQAALNKTEALLCIIWNILSAGAKFTFKTYADVRAAWQSATEQLTPFQHHVLPVHYKEQDLEFDLYMWPLWDWVLDLLADPLLAPHFIWDAQRLYKHNGTRYEQFIDEPWTADRWWKIQSVLPADNGVPFAFILYADKTWLSSFGTVKAYPVITQCGNLPVELRNGKGVNGGRLIRWLPIVPEDSEEDGKLSYVTLKHVVWHESFHKLLETIALLSNTGLNDHSLATDYPCRTTEDTQARLELYRQNRAVGEKTLKDQSLRLVEVKLHLSGLGWAAMKMVDAYDGNTFQDIAKQILYMTQNVLTRKADPVTRVICSTSRGTLIVFKGGTHEEALVDWYTTLEEGEAELLDIYIGMTWGSKNWNFPKAHSAKHAFHNIREKGASRNFSTYPNESEHGPIKCYYLHQTNGKDIANQIIKLDHNTYVSQMIWCKGDRNAEVVISGFLSGNARDCVLRLNALLSQLDQEDEDHLAGGLTLNVLNMHHHAGAPQVSTTFKALETAHLSDQAFQNFHRKLATFINNLFLVQDILVDIQVEPAAAHDKLQEHHYLKVYYESTVDWKLTTDYLCCNPSFHGHERHNCALYTVAGRTLDLVLIQPMDAPTGPLRAVDHDLRLRHFHSQPPASTEFISLQSIIRGALLVPDFSRSGDFFLIDHVDGNMFIRAQQCRL